MSQEPIETGKIVQENRQLRAALETLLDELEASSGTSVDVAAVREQMPIPPGERNPIKPPWERDGYESKQAWIAEQRPDSA